MAIGKITRADDSVTVTSTEGDTFQFRLVDDGSLEQSAAPLWAQDRQPSKGAGKARLTEARMAAAGWLAERVAPAA